MLLIISSSSFDFIILDDDNLIAWSATICHKNYLDSLYLHENPLKIARFAQRYPEFPFPTDSMLYQVWKNYPGSGCLEWPRKRPTNFEEGNKECKSHYFWDWLSSKLKRFSKGFFKESRYFFLFFGKISLSWRDTISTCLWAKFGALQCTYL